MKDFDEITSAFSFHNLDLHSAAKMLKKSLIESEPDQVFKHLIDFLPSQGRPTLAFLVLFKLYKSKLKAKEIIVAGKEESLKRSHKLMQRAYEEVTEKEKDFQNILDQLDLNKAELHVQKEKYEAILKELKRKLKIAEETITSLEALISTPSLPAERSECASFVQSEKKETEVNDQLYEDLFKSGTKLEETKIELKELKHRVQKMLEFLNSCSEFFCKNQAKTFERIMQVLLAIIQGNNITFIFEDEEIFLESEEEDKFIYLLKEKVNSLENVIEELLKEMVLLRQKLEVAHSELKKTTIQYPQVPDFLENEHKPSKEDRKANLFKKFLNLNIKTN